MLSRADTDVQKDIMAELKWDPGVRDDDISAWVRDGVVTLAGYADSYSDKWKAGQIATRMHGVKAVVNNLEVRLPASLFRPDSEIARAAQDALRWNTSVPHDRIKVKVHKGWLTLEGEVDWYFQKEAAESSVRCLYGLKGLADLVTVQRRPTPSDVRQRVKAALQRRAPGDAEHLMVEIDGKTVILSGTLRSYAELQEVEREARNAPGVTEIQNRITVDPTADVSVTTHYLETPSLIISSR